MRREDDNGLLSGMSAGLEMLVLDDTSYDYTTLR